MLMLDPKARAELGPSAARLAGGFVERGVALFGSRGAGRRRRSPSSTGPLLDELTRGTVTDEQRAARLAAVQEVVLTTRR